MAFKECKKILGFHAQNNEKIIKVESLKDSSFSLKIPLFLAHFI